MKSLLTLSVIFMFTGIANAKKNCTDQPKDKWMTEEAFKTKVEAEGFKIRKFKQPGSCYEIYGTNKEGKDVEIYYNPVDGSAVKSK
ncbi:MAG: PepSY domain-containing protein [Pseudobdellovibrio sp.]